MGKLKRNTNEKQCKNNNGNSRFNPSKSKDTLKVNGLYIPIKYPKWQKW